MEMTLEELFGHLKRQIEAHRDMGLEPPPLSSRLRAYLNSDPGNRTEPKATLKPPETLESLRCSARECTRCALHHGRTRVVFGEGNPRARLIFVGKWPGGEEDAAGKPMAGEAGDLLHRIIDAMGLTREAVYICNMVLCRPPGNRNPHKNEVEACLPFLKKQLDIIRPEVVCVLGRLGVEGLLGPGEDLARVRGRWRTYLGIPLLATHHPSFLLKNPEAKRQTWEDVKKIMKRLKLGGKRDA